MTSAVESIPAAGTLSGPGLSPDPASSSALRAGGRSMALIDWFIPAEVRSSRTDWELARTFVFTHIFGPLIAQPLWIYLYAIAPQAGSQLITLALAICSFWALPFALRATGNMWLVSLVSFQGLAMTSLFGSYHYGGFSSPFLPWLVVSLLLGLFYLSKNTGLVLSLFVLDIAAFLAVVLHRPLPDQIPVAELSVLGWLSIGSATIYMTWMALYYSVVVGLRAEFEFEAERSRATSLQLERARAKAEETGRARARFFAKMSHELRTPLNAIIGYSDILLEELEDAPQGEDRRAEDVTRINQDVTRINAAGKHLLSLVSNVLDSDAIERDETRVEPVTFTLGDLCDEVVATALPVVEKNGNRFVAFCPHRDRSVRTDPKMLRQVIINLLANAGKFTSNGVVKLDLRLEGDPREPRLRAIVSDTGIGIPSATLSRLFTDYEQGDASVGANFGGTGIGLALSRRLCRLLGGEISVSSRPGQGSRFAATLPAVLEADPGASGAGSELDTEAGVSTGS